MTAYLLEVSLPVPGYSQMALHTAALLLRPAPSPSSARAPERRLMAVLTDDHAGGAATRRLLPIVIVVPVLIGWLRLRGTARRPLRHRDRNAAVHLLGRGEPGRPRLVERAVVLPRRRGAAPRGAASCAPARPAGASSPTPCRRSSGRRSRTAGSTTSTARWFDYTGFDRSSTWRGSGRWSCIPTTCRARWSRGWRRSSKGVPLRGRAPLPARLRRRVPLAPRRAPCPSATPNGAIAKWYATCTDIEDQKTATEVGGAREPRQERVPGQHEPRDPHADERHHRAHRAAAGHAADARAARLPADGRRLRRSGCSP